MIYPPHLQKRYAAEDRLREFFNSRAENTSAPEQPGSSPPALRQTIERLGLCRDDRVLDIGCGDGSLCRTLSPLCPEGSVVGLDISDGMIRLARERSVGFENILYAPGAAEEIPWAEDYFTRIVAVESAYYWPSPEAAAREMFRVTNFGGEIFLLLSLYEENPHAHHWSAAFDPPLPIRSTAEWVKILENSGFERVESEQLAHPDAALDDSAADDIACHPWPSPEQHREFRRVGPLLARAAKPKLSPSGRITVDPDPDPLRILD